MKQRPQGTQNQTKDISSRSLIRLFILIDGSPVIPFLDYTAILLIFGGVYEYLKP